jgi:hypothetical protein
MNGRVVSAAIVVGTLLLVVTPIMAENEVHVRGKTVADTQLIHDIVQQIALIGRAESN